jgi:biotin synthase-like enzyme
MTLGMLTEARTELAGSGFGLLQPQSTHLQNIIKTSPHEVLSERLSTLGHVRDSGMKVCSGGRSSAWVRAKLIESGLLQQL